MPQPTVQPITQQIAYVSLLVDDYDKAIHFYTQQLGFVLTEDTELSPEKRWVVVQPPGTGGCGLLLAKATTAQQKAAIGAQSGGRVFLFLHTQNFEADYARLQQAGVQIIREKSVEPYGTVAVFADLYGNLIDLIQPA